ncbi:hypothetical protein M9H77_27424 [Catharanthus roseus]|uniref:Uncharacterized protein n=1 Tax=Catharanthus roseus TaxID=4058 RepID=A0ACC0AD13_CATRO|nr:hypothetical protein M9H77_27424 [Catharanthus roseus]
MGKKPILTRVTVLDYVDVFGNFRGLHCTWLVPRTRASSDGVDDLNSGEWIHLKRGIDHRECGPIGLRGHRIMHCGGVRPPSEKGVEAALMCLDSLRLPSCSKPLFRLVPRGLQIPYSAAVDLVERLGLDRTFSPVGLTSSKTKHKLLDIRLQLDMMSAEEPYIPDRVVRQFGYRQCIPAHPIRSQEASRPANNRMYIVRNLFVEALLLEAPSHLLKEA